MSKDGRTSSCRVNHPLAVRVPGTGAGTSLALERYGTMHLSELIGPAISLVELHRPLICLDRSLVFLLSGNASASLAQGNERTAAKPVRPRSPAEVCTPADMECGVVRCENGQERASS